MAYNNIVISDLHLSAGVDPENGTTSKLEDFTRDDEFTAFIEWLSQRDEAPWNLILAGDVFDFQQVNKLPTLEQVGRYNIPVYRDDLDRKAARQAGLPKKNIYHHQDFIEAGIYDLEDLWSIEVRFEGLGTGEAEMRFKTHVIVDGHPLFFKAIARFLAADNRVTVLRGNHDVEMAWPVTHEVVRRAVLGYLPDGQKKHLDNLRFLAHYYYEKGKIFVVHGQQGEAATAIRNVFSPYIRPKNKDGRVIDLDFSSFLVRYLVNRVENINPLSDNIRPRNRYYTWLVAEHPLKAVSITATVVPKLRKILNKFSKPPGLEEAERENEAERQRNAEQMDLPQNAAKALSMIEEEPTLSMGYISLIGKFMWLLLFALLQFIGIASFLAVYFLLEWYGLIQAVDNFFLRAMLAGSLVTLAVGVMGALFLWILNWLDNLRSRQKLDRLNKGPQPHYRSYAFRLHQALRKYDAAVPFIVLGHTHYCDRYQLDYYTWYFNTGTWMTLINPEELVFRERLTLSFFEQVGDRGQLFEFNPQSRSARPVVVEE